LTLIAIQDQLKTQVREAALDIFGIELGQITTEAPPRPELGDLAFPISFELAKLIKEASGTKLAPRVIAEKLKDKLSSSDKIARIDVAGAGYLNVFFDRAKLLAAFANSPSSKEAELSLSDRPKQMVEHTSINPNKAAHIGHVRNAVLGDTFVRILMAAGERVEVQNYIDNTGVQVADVVVGFIHLEHMTLEDIKALDRSLPSDRPFDYYCWDLYTRAGLFYRRDDPSGELDQSALRLRNDSR